MLVTAEKNRGNTTYIILDIINEIIEPLNS